MNKMEKKLEITYDVMHTIAEKYNISITMLWEEISLKILEIICQVEENKNKQELNNKKFLDFKKQVWIK